MKNKVNASKLTYENTSWFFVELVFFSMICLVPFSVHAGVFSIFWNKTLPQESAEGTYVQDYNPQTMPLLQAAIHTDPNPAKGGGDIIVEDNALVPGGDIGGGKDSIGNIKSANGEISLYTVREGDTLSQIAEMFGVSAKTVLWANDLTDPNSIRPGTDLVILPITGVRHVVKKGDTLKSIAKKYEGDVDDIMSYNQLISYESLTVGDTIVIPDGTITTPASTKSASSRGNLSTVNGGGSAGFTHPVPGAVRTQGIHGYNGVDFGAGVGTPVLAAQEGSVIVSKSSGWNGGYGLYVVIKHANGTQTLYAHLSRTAVAIGDSVTQGQVIGYVGNTGRSTGPHLHFEVRGARNPF